VKVGVIGCGHVGSTAAFAMALRGTATEIVLVDADPDMARAQAEDIRHATSFGPPIRVRAGEVDALENAAVVVLACGVGQRPGESRLQLLGGTWRSSSRSSRRWCGTPGAPSCWSPPTRWT
jgi:L-lactate dehydrogenase